NCPLNVVLAHSLYIHSLYSSLILPFLIFFFFNDPSTTEIYTLSLHDALPIFLHVFHDVHLIARARDVVQADDHDGRRGPGLGELDRKSTRLNSSHVEISYAVFCLKKKKKNRTKKNKEAEAQ